MHNGPLSIKDGIITTSNSATQQNSVHRLEKYCEQIQKTNNTKKAKLALFGVVLFKNVKGLPNPKESNSSTIACRCPCLKKT